MPTAGHLSAADSGARIYTEEADRGGDGPSPGKRECDDER